LIGEKEDVGAALGGVDVMEPLCSEPALLPVGETPATFLANLSFSRNLKPDVRFALLRYMSSGSPLFVVRTGHLPLEALDSEQPIFLRTVPMEIGGYLREAPVSGVLAWTYMEWIQE
jgi:hypothetical protein